jgi:hypothetical protein
MTIDASLPKPSISGLARVVSLPPKQEPRDDDRDWTSIGSNDGGDATPILDSGTFVRGFVPPTYLLDGILQGGFCYTFTGATGSGKTTVSLRLMACVGLGRDFAGRSIEKGRVLMLVGENPDDVRARWIALAEQMGFDADEIDVHFMPGVFSIRDSLPRIQERALAIGGFALVVVDTSAAYFEGTEENSNKELGDHARMLRALTTIRGTPCVIANCHPPKNATADNLLPRGGGSFLAEVDGNLTCAKTDGIVEMHWQGKFRGPDFESIALELVTVESPSLVNSKGRQMPTIVARPLSDTEQKARTDAADIDRQRLLIAMLANPRASIAALAEEARWMIAGGKPHKSKVSRLLVDLKREKLVAKELNAWLLTPAGEKAANRVQK